MRLKSLRAIVVLLLVAGGGSDFAQASADASGGKGQLTLVQFNLRWFGQRKIENGENKEIIEVGLAENNTATEAELKAAIDAHIAINEAAAKATQKAALLERLGISEDEARLLLA